MSSNKTIIPGMEDTYQEPNFGRNNGANEVASNGTCFPNSYSPIPNAVSNQKPIVGFLYSISKSLVGEFWPLRIGSNSIGRSADCDVCLGEATVSEQHAVLVVRQMKNPEKIIASICDARSTCGTMINGESLGFDQHECFNGDIITIGEHYDLYLILIDAKQIGLNVCKDFIGTHRAGPNLNNMQNNASPYTPPTMPNGATEYEGKQQEKRENGTVGYDDSSSHRPSTKPGGTIFM